MSSFRIFGRPAGPPAEPGAPDAGAATHYARPAPRTEELLGGAPEPDDPPTDPFGFAPVRPQGATGPGSPPWRPLAPSPWPPSSGRPADDLAGTDPPPLAALGNSAPRPWPDGAPGGPVSLPPDLADPASPVAAAAGPAPDPAEASALAAAFAADYLSWDEDDPHRRATVLADYVGRPGPVRLGWSGKGRQRADFALPGLVRPDGEGRVLVDVRVRVTPYQAVGERRPVPEPPTDEGPATWAAAPAPAARGWRSLPGRWIRVGVAVVVDGDRLVVDAEEEILDDEDTGRESLVLGVPGDDR